MEILQWVILSVFTTEVWTFDKCWALCLLHLENLLKRVQPKFFLPEFSFKFISVWTHYLSHTDLPDFCWIEVWACSWVTIALKETNIVSQNHHKKSEIKENCFCRCKLTTQVWASPLRQGQYGKSWANESQGTSSLNNWKPERQKKQEISSGFCAKTCSEKRNWKKDNPVRLADYATVGSHRFEPFALTKG